MVNRSTLRFACLITVSTACVRPVHRDMPSQDQCSIETARYTATIHPVPPSSKYGQVDSTEPAGVSANAGALVMPGRFVPGTYPVEGDLRLMGCATSPSGLWVMYDPHSITDEPDQVAVCLVGETKICFRVHVGESAVGTLGPGQIADPR